MMYGSASHQPMANTIGPIAKTIISVRRRNCMSYD